MKLYRVTQFNEGGRMPILTHFLTSFTKASAKAREMKANTAQGGTIVISAVIVADRLTSADWIDLLETDAPGLQDVNRTAVDFIESATEVARSEW